MTLNKIFQLTSNYPVLKERYREEERNQIIKYEDNSVKIYYLVAGSGGYIEIVLIQENLLYEISLLRMSLVLEKKFSKNSPKKVIKKEYKRYTYKQQENFIREVVYNLDLLELIKELELKEIEDNMEELERRKEEIKKLKIKL